MRITGLVVSVVGHLVLIAWGIFSLATASPPEINIEAVPVEFVSLDETTDLDRGLETAAIKPEPSPNDPNDKPVEEPKPVAKAPPKVEPTPPPPTPAPKVEPQPEVAKEEPPALPAEPKPAEAPAPEAAPDATAADPPPDTAAAPPPEPEKTAMVPPTPRIRPKPPTPVAEEKTEDFDSDKIAALLDKSTPAAPADVSTSEATLGVAKGTAEAKMTQNELAALIAQVSRCWTYPMGWTDPSEVSVTLRFALNMDGSVAGQPEVVAYPAGQYGRVATENAIRAVLRCGPYRLPPEKYAGSGGWNEVQVRLIPLG
jgi:hypothetical protein